MEIKGVRLETASKVEMQSWLGELVAIQSCAWSVLVGFMKIVVASQES